jgi:hyperosmotically inducible periplasmic protein
MISAFALTACSSSPHSQTTGAVVDDAWITSKVKSSLLSDNLVSGTDVSVETYQGRVMLSGFVDAESQMDRAVEIAKSVEGVKKVVNKLELKSKQMGQSGTFGESR